MDSNIKTITVSNGDSNLPRGKRDYLVYDDPGLVPCTLTEDDDGFSLDFETASSTPISEMKDKGIEKFRLLANCSELVKLGSRYAFTLAPENVYFDSNLIPKVLMRDYGTVSEEEFIKQYKALIASVINDQYTYADYYNGGDDLYKKDKTVNSINDKETIEEIKDELLSTYKSKKDYLDERFVYVDKVKEKRMRIICPIVSVLLVLSLLCVSYLAFIKIPLDKKIMSANEAFLNSDYITVQTTLADVDLDKLPYMTKYILAVSYLKSVDLDQESKQYELAQLTTMTEETRFDFWIHIGRLQYEEAIDDAQRLNSDRHLFYAYVGYKKYVENNLDLSGGEKESLLNELEGKISALRDKLVEIQSVPEETVEETTEETAATEETEVTEETVPEETASAEENASEEYAGENPDETSGDSSEQGSAETQSETESINE